MNPNRSNRSPTTRTPTFPFRLNWFRLSKPKD
jgi:hypothetical protein